MAPTRTAQRPGGHSLSSYHRERAALYGVLVALLDEHSSPAEFQLWTRRLHRLRGSLHRARPWVERALAQPDLVSARSRHRQALGGKAERALLSTLGDQSARCAEALSDGDMASAADLWNTPISIDAEEWRSLARFARELEALGGPLADIGRGLTCLVEDDLALESLTDRLGVF